MAMIRARSLRQIRTCAAALNACNRLHYGLINMSVGAVHTFALPEWRRVRCTVNSTGWPQFPASARAIDLPITLVRERFVSPSGEELCLWDGEIGKLC